MLLVVSETWCSAQESSRESLDSFENRVRPLLVERCLECHGSGKSEAGLSLDNRDSLLEGGDIGANQKLESEVRALKTERERLEAQGPFQRALAAIDQDEPHDSVIHLLGLEHERLTTDSRGEIIG